MSVLHNKYNSSFAKLSAPLSKKSGSSDSPEMRLVNIQFGMFVVREAGLLSNKELISIYKMIHSPDEENLLVAEEIIKNKLDNYKDEE